MTQETHPDVTHRHVDVRVSSKTTTHMLLGSLSSLEGSVGKERSGAVCKAYFMFFTFETFHVLKSPLKALAHQNMRLRWQGGGVRGERR